MTFQQNLEIAAAKKQQTEEEKAAKKEEAVRRRCEAFDERFDRMSKNLNSPFSNTREIRGITKVFVCSNNSRSYFGFFH